MNREVVALDPTGKEEWSDIPASVVFIFGTERHGISRSSADIVVFGLVVTTATAGILPSPSLTEGQTLRATFEIELSTGKSVSPQAVAKCLGWDRKKARVSQERLEKLGYLRQVNHVPAKFRTTENGKSVARSMEREHCN